MRRKRANQGGGGPESPGQAESPNTRSQEGNQTEQQTGREAGADRNLGRVEACQPGQRTQEMAVRGWSHMRKLAVVAAEQWRGGTQQIRVAPFLRCGYWVPSAPPPEVGTGAWGVQQDQPWLLPGLPGRRVEIEAGTGAQGVQQEQPWLLPGLPGSVAVAPFLRCGCWVPSAPPPEAGTGSQNLRKWGELPAWGIEGDFTGESGGIMSSGDTLHRMNLVLEEVFWRAVEVIRQGGHRGAVGKVKSGQG